MNFSCDNCQRRYSIPDEKVRGKTVKIRCKNCQSIITLTGPSPEPEIPDEDRTRMVPLNEIERIRASSLTDVPAVAPPPKKPAWEDEPTKTAPPLDPTIQWFAMLKGKQVGPMDADALTQRVASGDVSPRTYMWKQGMADWKRAAEIPELAAVLAGAPQPTPPPAEMPRAAPRTWQEPQPEPASQSFFPFDSPAESGQAAAQPSGPVARPADLFSDLDLDRGEETAEADAPGAAEANGGKQDPFAALGSVDPAKVPPPQESTSYYIAKSGVKNRNPPWKIALFVISLIAVPVGVLYLLSELRVVPLEVTRVNEKGEEVKESVFSAGGVSGLRDLLLGRKPQVAPNPPAKQGKPAQARQDGDKPQDKGKTRPSAQEIADFYNSNPDKKDLVPRVRPSDQNNVPAADSASAEGPPEAEVSKVVEQHQQAFQGCIEAELKKNPNFKGGKVKVVATIGSSGTVKRAVIDRREIDGSSLGECLKSRAKRMTFSAFSGDDVDLEIPLILSTTM